MQYFICEAENKLHYLCKFCKDWVAEWAVVWVDMVLEEDLAAPESEEVAESVELVLASGPSQTYSLRQPVDW